MCTEVVSTRLPESLFITVSLIQKNDTKTENFLHKKFNISRTEYTREKIQTAYKFHLNSLSDAINFVTKKLI